MSAMRSRAFRSSAVARYSGRGAVSIACKRSAEVLALLEAQSHPRIQLPELRVDLRQQRLVVLPAQSDDVVESIEAGLPCA